MANTDNLKTQLDNALDNVGQIVGVLHQQNQALISGNEAAVEEATARIATLESSLETLTGGVDGNTLTLLQEVQQLFNSDVTFQQSINQLNADLEVAKTLADSNNSLISGLQTEMSTAQSSISTNANLIGTLQTALNSLTARVTAIETDLANFAITAKDATISGFEKIAGENHGVDFSAVA